MFDSLTDVSQRKNVPHRKQKLLKGNKVNQTRWTVDAKKFSEKGSKGQSRPAHRVVVGGCPTRCEIFFTINRFRKSLFYTIFDQKHNNYHLTTYNIFGWNLFTVQQFRPEIDCYKLSLTENNLLSAIVDHNLYYQKIIVTKLLTMYSAI